VQRVTNAPVPLDVDISRRTRRYLIQMGIRTACFLLAIVVPGVLRWVFLAAAVVLPYVAVLLANAGREHQDVAPMGVDPRPLPPGVDRPALEHRSDS
jgi:Protein of unknown function (DUF3099)